MKHKTIQKKKREARGLLEGDPAKMPRGLKYAILRDATPMPAAEAVTAAGYSANTHSTDLDRSKTVMAYREVVREQRAKLAEKMGFRLEDNARWFMTWSKKRSASDASRVQARKELSKIMGHYAPLEFTKEEDKPEIPAVVTFIQYIREMRMTPKQLKDSLEQVPEAEVVPPQPVKTVGSDKSGKGA